MSRRGSTNALRLLLTVWLLFFAVVFEDSAAGFALRQQRECMRAYIRRRAMGTSGLFIDMSTSLLHALLLSIDFDGIYDEFLLQGDGFDRNFWTPEQMMRSVYRRGAMLGEDVFPMIIIQHAT